MNTEWLGPKRFKVYFDRHDAWIGIYWKLVSYPKVVPSGVVWSYSEYLQVYLCIIPFFPIRFSKKAKEFSVSEHYS